MRVPAGLSLPKAGAIAGIGALVGAGLDVASGHAVIALFAAGFAVGCAIAVLTVRREDAFRLVVGVPLAYLALLIVGGLASTGSHMPVWLAEAFITKAPVVLIATAVAAVCALARRVPLRQPR